MHTAEWCLLTRGYVAVQRRLFCRFIARYLPRDKATVCHMHARCCICHQLFTHPQRERHTSASYAACKTSRSCAVPFRCIERCAEKRTPESSTSSSAVQQTVTPRRRRGCRRFMRGPPTRFVQRAEKNSYVESFSSHEICWQRARRSIFSCPCPGVFRHTPQRRARRDNVPGSARMAIQEQQLRYC